MKCKQKTQPYNCNFRVIGIRMEPCGQNTELQTRVKAMQKALYGNGKWFYFYQGFEIADDLHECAISENAFADSQLYNLGDITVSICALVGKNGTGKSTIIDMMIRVLNNLSATILGEDELFPAASHLHFIEDVYASLAVYVDGKIVIITCKGRTVTITKLERKRGETTYTFDDELELMTSGNNNPDEYLGALENYYDELTDLFYTAVFNYSLYAFNYRDYPNEITPAQRLTSLGIIPKNEEDKYWLKGVFHKNDGYQTPIVLNPMREDGRLNVVKENLLAKERLFSLLFYQSDDNRYPFRTINEKLQIVGINVKRGSSQTYDKNFVLKKLEIDLNEPLATHYQDKYDMIIELWAEVFDPSINPIEVEDPVTTNYIVYKTIKISMQYRKYERLYLWLNSEEDNRDSVRSIIEELNQDDSHITIKLRRALNFLKWYPVDGHYRLGSRTLEELCSEMDFHQELSIEADEDNTLTDFVSKEELLPPPSFDFDFEIVPVEKLRADGTYDKQDIIPFEGLSAGERQIAYTVSNVMYHLVNIDSVWDDFNQIHSVHQQDFKYKYVNLLFDELELYFHPELQRLFVTYILNAIKSGRLSHIKGVNIMMVTHSPFVLSDLPQTNILYLSSAPHQQDKEPTFGANIIEMLSSSFFMDYTIGAFAQRQIEDIVAIYNMPKVAERRERFEASKIKMAYLSETVADSYVSGELRNMYRDMLVEYSANPRQVLRDELIKHQQAVAELEVLLDNEGEAEE